MSTTDVAVDDTRCPACGSEEVASVVFGFPDLSLLDGPDVVLGGCCVDGTEQPFVCRRCGAGWGR